MSVVFNTNITDIYYGNNKIQEIYYGDQLVYVSWNIEVNDYEYEIDGNKNLTLNKYVGSEKNITTPNINGD